MTPSCTRPLRVSLRGSGALVSIQVETAPPPRTTLPWDSRMLPAGSVCISEMRGGWPCGRHAPPHHRRQVQPDLSAPQRPFLGQLTLKQVSWPHSLSPAPSSCSTRRKAAHRPAKTPGLPGCPGSARRLAGTTTFWATPPDSLHKPHFEALWDPGADIRTALRGQWGSRSSPVPANFQGT